MSNTAVNFYLYLLNAYLDLSILKTVNINRKENEF